MKAYKLFRKLSDGNITSLFINKTVRLPFGEWMDAEDHLTNGFAYRPGWHCTRKPYAPHLIEEGRVWCLVEIEDYRKLIRPERQGGVWFLANRMKVIKELNDEKN